MLIKWKNDSIELPSGSSVKDLVKKLHLHSPSQSLGACINGTALDLSTELKDGDVVNFWDFDSLEGKEIYWHTSAHVLAQAVLRLWPEAKPTIGPPIEQGFYYDFANLTISDEDFPKIEKEVKKIISENYITEKVVLTSKKEAKEAFQGNSYKLEIINELPENAQITAYRQGEFVDLCRGPHLSNLGKIKSFKLLKTSGAYWRADAKNEMLTRIYGISFPDKKLLKEYLTFLSEAKKRDHKVLGPKLNLFCLKEEAPGMPFILPKGMIIWNQLLNFWQTLHQKHGYSEIKTPTMMTKDLWVTSGHWENYRENMFTSDVESREFAIKPMNCPGVCLYYKSVNHSYRELPLKIGEIGHVHRFEPSGAISGLFRVRSFHQDDAHIFMKPSDIEKEILDVLDLTEELYKVFGLKYSFELSTRPEKGTIGTDEDWEVATAGLKGALDHSKREYRINEGDGAFYGPKIDMHIEDALGRTWQCGTIQLDMALPEKFNLEYTSQDGSKKRPIMIHRAIFGSVERFFGILIEHYSGRFPLWLSPRQVRILPVADRHVEFAKKQMKRFVQEGFYCDCDDSHDSVSKKVRRAQLDQVNYILTVGDQEVDNNTLSLRTRNNVVHGEVELTTFLEKIYRERQEKLLTSPYAEK